MAVRIHCLKCLMMAHSRSYATAVGAVPRITMPHNIINRMDRLKAKDSARKHQKQRFYKGPLVISCKRKEFNHYRGQTYSDFSPHHLASGGWKHRKSVGDYFTINAYQGNPAILRDTDVDFTTLGLNDDLVRGLTDGGIMTPTNIQALTIPHLLEGKNLLCAAETGSGKTLAFLLPILHKIASQKRLYASRPEGMNSPYAVILTPARELADQIYNVAEGLAPYVDCKTAVYCGGRGTQNILRDPPSIVSDIVISTPGIFSKLYTNRMFSRDRLTNIVLDEADTMLDDSFSPLIIRLLEKLKITSERFGGISDNSTEVSGMQIAMVGATLPKNLAGILGDVVPTDTVETVTTSSLHRLMPHVPQKFLRINTQRKQEELLKAVQSKKDMATLIFCNKSSTANFVGHFLRENDVPNEVFHADMPQKVRNGRFDRLQDGTTKVLIATDIASRGLDTLTVQQVVNYDFPQFMSDYIHRVGRVGRVGSHSAGSVLSFVTHPWDVILLWKIESSARRTTELPSVNANIKQRLTEIVERKFHGEVKKEISL